MEGFWLRCKWVCELPGETGPMGERGGERFLVYFCVWKKIISCRPLTTLPTLLVCTCTCLHASYATPPTPPTYTTYHYLLAVGSRNQVAALVSEIAGSLYTTYISYRVLHSPTVPNPTPPTVNYAEL